MLTDRAIRSLKPGDKPEKHGDARGLYLHVQPSGAKWWRFDYRHGGKRKRISFGVYDDVTLADARDKLQEARNLLAKGIDPSEVRQQAKLLAKRGQSFETVAREWFGKQTISPATKKKILWHMNTCLFPSFGSTAVDKLTPGQVLKMAQKWESREKHETAHRAKQITGQILRYAVATGRASRDVTADLRGALTPVPTEHYPAITEPAKIGALLRAIDGMEDTPVVSAALKFAALVFVRPGELRKAEWDEFDLKAAVWRIPAARMKMRDAHLVPLSTQAVALLTDLYQWTGDGMYVFPSVRTKRRPMSDGTVNAALRRLGYDSGTMTAHGFRAMARTVLAEVLHFDPFIIEAQLAHVAPGPLGSAYNRAAYLKQRTAMLQAWADWLDTVRTAKA